MKNLINKLFTLAVIVLSLAVFSCGSSNHISGTWMNTPYEGDIRSVDVFASGFALGNPSYYGLGTGLAQLDIVITIENYMSYIPDQLKIGVLNASVLYPGETYSIGYEGNGISATMVLGGNIVYPAGSITFTKLNLNYSRKVCADFDLLVSSGVIGEFYGSFCGEVVTSYSY